MGGKGDLEEGEKGARGIGEERRAGGKVTKVGLKPK